MTEYWWRSWHNAPADNKWIVVARRAGVLPGIVSAIAWAMLDFASQNSERGSVAGFDPEAYAAYSGFAEGDIQSVMQAMTDKKILVDGKFANWDKRQPKSEGAIERATKSRMLRDVAPGCAPLRDVAPGCAPLRDVAPGCAPLRDVAIETETETETESETDTETETESETETDARDPFASLQRALEKKGIVLSGADDIQSIQEIVKMGATVQDLRDGLAWKAANNKGKPVRYVSSLIGPTRTAMQKRLQNGNGHQPTEERRYDYRTVDGRPCDQFGHIKPGVTA